MHRGLRFKSVILLLFYIALFVSVISQNFILRKSMPLETICDLCWVAMLGVILVGCRLRIKLNDFSELYIVCIAYNVLLVAMLKDGFFYGKYSFSISTFLPAPFLVYIISYQLMNLVKKRKNIDQIFGILILSGLVFVLSFIKIADINWKSWVNSYVYMLDDGKNAIGHILGILILVALFYSFDLSERKGSMIFNKVVCLLFVGLALIVIVYVQCRTALLAVAAIILFEIAITPGKFELKCMILVCALTLGALVIFYEKWNAIFTHAFYLDKYSDINSFSSGRIDSYLSALRIWKQYFLFGFPGTYYVDNFYLNQLAGNGIIGAIPNFILLLVRTRLNIKAYKNKKIYRSLRNVIMITTWYELIISLVEALPPFGPGVSVLIFWLVSAMADYLSGVNVEDQLYWEIKFDV